MPSSNAVPRLRAFFTRWGTAKRFPLRPLIEWIICYPLVLLHVLIPLGIVWGLGEALGLESLFWPESPGAQVLAGVSVAILLGEVTFLGFLLEAEAGKPWLIESDPVKDLRWYMIRSGTLPFLLAAFLVSVFAAPLPWGLRYGFPIGLFFGTAIVLALLEWWPKIVAGTGAVRRRVSIFAEGPTNDPRLEDLHWLQAIFFATVLVIYLFLLLAGWVGWVPPVAMAITAILGLSSGFYAFIRAISPKGHAGLTLVVFLGAVLVFSVPSTAPYRGLPSTLRDLDRPLPEPEEAGLIDGEAPLEAMLARSKRGERPKVVLVATSGGGIRAASWTTAVLSTLERRIPGITRQIRIVAGASGGMVGATMFVASIEAGDDADGHPLFSAAPGPLGDHPFWMVERVGQDSLARIAYRMAVPSGEDRGLALERSWESHAPVYARPMVELADGERAGWRPSLVYSPMLVEDGRRLLISNLDLGFATTSTGAVLPELGPYSVSAVELFKLFPRAPLPLSTAARMNAAFPYVSPASALPTDPSRRVVDAGYYDNYGVNVAAFWMIEHRKWLRDNTSGVVLIQIRDTLASLERSEIADPPAGPWTRWLGWLTSPIEAVLRARESTMSFRNDELVSVVDRLLGSKTQFFTTVAFELGPSAPLSWSLTSCQLDLLIANIEPRAAAIGCPEVEGDGAATKNAQALHALEGWWKAPH